MEEVHSAALELDEVKIIITNTKIAKVHVCLRQNLEECGSLVSNTTPHEELGEMNIHREAYCGGAFTRNNAHRFLKVLTLQITITYMHIIYTT